MRRQRPNLPLRDWDDVAEVYRDKLAAEYRRRGWELDSDAARITLDTNSVLVPHRGDNLLRYLADLLGYRSCQGLRVLEAGCGYGALATYLLWRGGMRELVAIDIDEDCLAVAHACSEQLGLSSRLRFLSADMRTLEGIEEEPFDLIIVNNAFIYLPSAEAARQALRTFHDRLVPGGGLLFYHANKWRLREPFTNDPIVHLLPAPAAKRVSRLTGWRHNHGRVRLLSPVELRRHLRHTGFVPVATTAVTRPPRTAPVLRNLGRFTVQAARREG